MGGNVGQAIGHPIRRRLIEAMWHSSEPLSAHRFHSEYVDANKVPLTTISYHVRVLERDGIAKLDREMEAGGSVERFFVLDGPQSGEAIRRLDLTT